MKDKYSFTTAKTIKSIVIYFLMFLAGDLLSGVVFDGIFYFIELPYRDLYVIPRAIGSLALTIFFFWFYTKKCLNLKLRDFGITFCFKKWGIIFSLVLPLLVVIVYCTIGETTVNKFASWEVFLIILTSMLTALKAGILEEMLFRGFIMRLLESRWNRLTAILLPSIVFSLAHIPSMEKVSAVGVFLLLVSGMLVGVMFSVAVYAGQSVGNSILIHSMWNFVMITDILHITTAQEAYGTPIFSIIIETQNSLLTGAGFGSEASLISIAGYGMICILAGLIWRRNHERAHG